MTTFKRLLISALAAGALFSGATLAETEAATPMEQTAAVTQTGDPAAMHKLNINTATAGEIKDALLGIGAKKAEAIVQYREKHGNFTDVGQLLEVKGIGQSILDKNRDRIGF